MAKGPSDLQEDSICKYDTLTILSSYIWQSNWSYDQNQWTYLQES